MEITIKGDESEIGKLLERMNDSPVTMMPTQAKTVTEYCNHCDSEVTSEVTMELDAETDGYKAYSPVCSGPLMLCNECLEQNNGLCNYVSKNCCCYAH